MRLSCFEKENKQAKNSEALRVLWSFFMEISKCCQILGQIRNIELEGTKSYCMG